MRPPFDLVGGVTRATADAYATLLAALASHRPAADAGRDYDDGPKVLRFEGLRKTA